MKLKCIAVAVLLIAAAYPQLVQLRRTQRNIFGDIINEDKPMNMRMKPLKRVGPTNEKPKSSLPLTPVTDDKAFERSVRMYWHWAERGGYLPNQTQWWNVWREKEEAWISIGKYIFYPFALYMKISEHFYLAYILPNNDSPEIGHNIFIWMVFSLWLGLPILWQLYRAAIKWLLVLLHIIFAFKLPESIKDAAQWDEHDKGDCDYGKVWRPHDTNK